MPTGHRVAVEAPARQDARRRRAHVAATRLWACWAVTRAVALALLVVVDPWVGDDLGYYGRGLGEAAASGAGGVLVEYPSYALLVMAVPWSVSDALDAPGAFAVAMVVALLALDAAFTVLLRRASPPGRAWSVGLLTWICGVPLLGATAFSRFDLVPGVVAGVAVLVMSTRPRTAATLVAVAAAVKLWPVALAGPLLATARSRASTLTTTVVCGLVLAAGSVLAVGLARTLSPLTWQSGRGLQVESLAATPAVLAWAFGVDGLHVEKTRFNAYEVAGPGTAALLTASQVATLVAGVLLVWLSLRVGRASPTGRAAATPWLVVGSVLLVVVPSKVLSPQYLLWLLPVAAASWAATPIGRAGPAWVWTRLLLVATALTQVVFPLFYGVLVEGGRFAPPVAAALGVRNGLLAVLLLVAARHVVRHTRRRAPSQAAAPGAVPADG